MAHDIRPYRAADLAALVETSRAADELFARAGIALPPDDPSELVERCEAILVAGDPLAGFVAAEEADGNLHIAQLSVRPELGRRGLGTLLLGAAAQVAAAEGFPALTLTTFRDVPWNGPWYRARGFAEFPRERWGRRLRALWAEEERSGVAVAPRIAMRRPVGMGRPLSRM
ncbi:GNAT family N-acetyltransferase [Segniliparus rugosus]|uniref:N-acetyltransferase domain-containing protein n=1 Tax=Segniliparus rugosus (strain ATCC BAA-974 / DSM 45345 / CCUG 50838 / CIP 108380 / JCM 13579 / CDC 945) TaxID=679197 RepID=E5XKW9_SEGRC|nr:GNAT family N-acetyltransferase [Segniliparus rugosus]EFV14951.1 hypothetical protein HMPREF9336_00138 [Segniliparus rugosus ATCC BAA-974]